MNVPVAAEVPWQLLEMVCVTAGEECKALFRGASRPGRVTRLADLLHKALPHAAGLLMETAGNDTYVSATRARLTSHDQTMT
jgi:hypothetical protein